MPKLRALAGKDLLRIFSSFDFHQHSQKGSHIKLSRTLQSGVYQTLTIVNHAEIDRGTLQSIYHQALASSGRSAPAALLYRLRGASSAESS